MWEEQPTAATFSVVVDIVFHFVRRERELQYIWSGSRKREREKNWGNLKFAQRETNKHK